MKVSSCNEWDPLKTVIVGDATGARFPEQDDIFELLRQQNAAEYGHGWHRGNFPDSVVDEAIADLENICGLLRNLGVTVLRPRPLDFSTIPSFS